MRDGDKWNRVSFRRTLFYPPDLNAPSSYSVLPRFTRSSSLLTFRSHLHRSNHRITFWYIVYAPRFHIQCCDPDRLETTFRVKSLPLHGAIDIALQRSSIRFCSTPIYEHPPSATSMMTWMCHKRAQICAVQELASFLSISS